MRFPERKNLSFLNNCQTDPLAPHPVFCQMGTGVYLPAVKRIWLQNWQFIPSTSLPRMLGVIYIHLLTRCHCVIFGKYGSKFVRTEMRRPMGRWELWYKVGRKLTDQISTFVFWPMSFVFINWITTLNTSTQVQVLQTTKGYYCFLSATHPIFYLFAHCISQPLIFTTAGISINTLYDSAGSVIHRGP
jgi:hypothetical protein